MKRNLRLVLLVTVLALLLASIGIASAGAARSPFMGRWESIDEVDGSYQTMTVAGGPRGSHRMVLRDNGATVCGLVGGVPVYAAVARGTGTEAGNTLTGTWDVYCLARPSNFVGNFSFTFNYDAVSDTLVDPAFPLTVWTRR